MLKKLAKIFLWIFLPISLIYSLIMRFRNLFYDIGIFKSKTYQKPFLIVVGNLTVGGTGKTPITEYLADLLKQDFKIAILSRGYKRKTKGFSFVETHNNYKDIGDEPLQIKLKFPQITVAVSEDRKLGIKNLMKKDNFDIIILDDAFQHRKIRGNLNILLTTCYRPFYKDIFLPVGRLRDNKYRYKQAQIIIFTKCKENLNEREKFLIIKKLKPLKNQTIYFSRIKYENIENLDKKQLKICELQKYEVLLITGIADPEPIKKFLQQNKIKFYHFSFADHYNFKEKDLLKIEKKFQYLLNPKIILTTEKDLIRLKNLKNFQKIKQNLYVLKIKTEFLFNLQQYFNLQIKSYVGKN